MTAILTGKRTILLNPGPVTLSQGVRDTALSVDHCHREAEFLAIQQQVIDGLLAVYGCDAHWRAVALGGSGTTAMEAMLCSLLPSGARLLVAENGVYGERLSRIAEIHQVHCERLKAPWDAALDLAAIERALQDPKLTHCAVVHHETTTGRLNPLDDLLELCARHEVQLLLDGVSSFGAEAIPFEHPALVGVAGTANKCLHGIPGLAFVVCRSDLLSEANPQRSLYLHLPAWAQKQSAGSTPFTPPVPAYLALQQALVELAEQGGWQARRDQYRKLADSVRQTLEGLGIAPWLPPEESSCVLRSYRLPSGVTYNQVHAGLKKRGFIVYEGQGGLAKEMFRISTMGEITVMDLQRLQAALEAVFDS